MKQPVRLYAWLIGLGLLVSHGLLAQSDSSKPKSRLELGQKPAPASRIIHSRNFPFLKHPSVSSLDRGVTVQKNVAITQFYRNQLLTNSTSKAPVRTVNADSGNSAAQETHQSPEDAQKDDRWLFENDRIVVSNIYPNPADESAEIDYQISGTVKDAKLIFYNVMGAQVGEYILDRNERKIRIATNVMSPGMYFYQLSLDGKKMKTKKLMVSRR
ncbi:hypothetical protein GCM10027347_41240 [Larkinella harenae]